MEPLPLLGMVVHAVYDAGSNHLRAANRPAFYWTLAEAFGNFIGGGVWGFMMTLPQINLYSHGTQWTASHGHFAFWGAYGCGVIAVLYLALEKSRGYEGLDGRAWKWSFALLNIGMLGMVGALLVAGMDQAFYERAIGGSTWGAFLAMQGRPWFIEGMWTRFAFGLLFACGYAILVYDLLAARRARGHRQRIDGGGRIMTPAEMLATALLLGGFRHRRGRIRSAVLRGADLGSQDAPGGRPFELYGAVPDRICAVGVYAAACRMESAGGGELCNLPDDSAGHLALPRAASSRGEDSMIPDLVATLIAIVVVCVTVLDQPLLDPRHGLLLVAGLALFVLGVIANRVDYLKWPGIAIAAAGIAILTLIVWDCHRHLLRPHSGWCSGAETSPD